MLPPRPDASSVNVAPVFAALGDVTRLALLSRLDDGRPRSITELGQGLSLTRQGVSKHLRVLEEAGIVSSTRVGRESRFAIDPSAIEAAQGYLARVSRQWDATLSRLKRHLED